MRGSRASPRRAARGIAFDDEQLGGVAVAGRAVRELVGHAHAVERGLAARELPRLLRGAARSRRVRSLADDRLGRVRVFLEPTAEVLVGRALYERAHLGVAELGLRLPLELRVGEPHRDDGGEAFAHVVALERRVLRLQQVARLGVAVDRLRERALETLGVHAAFGRGDAVGVAVQAFVVAGVPLPRDLHLALGPGLGERADVGEQRFLGVVEVADEVDDAGVVAEGHVILVAGPLVAERDREAAVEERHHLQALGHGRRAELDLLEHSGIGPERDRRAGVPTLRCRDRLQLPLRDAGLHRSSASALLDRVLLTIGVAVAVDLEHEAGRRAR